jgi:hypothetical protein
MTYFDEHPGPPTPEMPREQITYLRRVLATHANQPATGACQICGTPSCPDWRDAFDQLAAAGQLLADPQHWQPPDDQRR